MWILLYLNPFVALVFIEFFLEVAIADHPSTFPAYAPIQFPVGRCIPDRGLSLQQV
jgi:hypothetical protein